MNENENGTVNNNSVSGEVNPPQADNADYIAAIKELQGNTVSKAQYDKLKLENKNLLSALINGETIEVEPEKKVDVSELRKELFSTDGDISNLDYITKVLDLRDALMESGERDPFLPTGNQVRVTAEMIDQANNVADVLRECVDFSQGDSGIFTAELQRRMKDPMPTALRRGR